MAAVICILGNLAAEGGCRLTLGLIVVVASYPAEALLRDILALASSNPEGWQSQGGIVIPWNKSRRRRG